MKRVILAGLALAGLGGCVTLSPGSLEFQSTQVGQAFFRGPVSVVADRHGEIEAFKLYACGVNRACIGDVHGRAGHASLEGDATVVRGLKAGHTYYLMPGGTGFVRVHGEGDVPLAWD